MTTTAMNTPKHSWGVIAARCRAAHFLYDELSGVSDGVGPGEEPQTEDDRAHQKAERRANKAWEAARTYPVANLVDLASKASLLADKEFDHREALNALADDLERLTSIAFPVRDAWRRAVCRWEEACANYKAVEGRDAPEAISAKAHDEWSDAWEALIDCPAPDQEATAYKLQCIVDAHDDSLRIGEHAGLLALQRFLNDRNQHGPFPLVRLLQDATRQSRQNHLSLHLDRQRVPRTA